MRKIQNRLEGFEKPIETAILPQAQEHKAEQDKPTPEQLKQLTLPFLGSIAEFLKKQLDLLSSKKRKKIGSSEKRKILENLSAFRKLLNTLTQIDQSYNPEFIQKMSELWSDIIVDYYYLKSLDKKNVIDLAKMDSLIRQINSFPKEEEHSLGYYLAEYVGKKWLPFPFIQCMQLLHEEHQKTPAKSHLQEFMSLLNEIISAPESK